MVVPDVDKRFAKSGVCWLESGKANKSERIAAWVQIVCCRLARPRVVAECFCLTMVSPSSCVVCASR